MFLCNWNYFNKKCSSNVFETATYLKNESESNTKLGHPSYSAEKLLYDF